MIHGSDSWSKIEVVYHLVESEQLLLVKLRPLISYLATCMAVGSYSLWKWDLEHDLR